MIDGCSAPFTVVEFAGGGLSIEFTRNIAAWGKTSLPGMWRGSIRVVQLARCQ
jgi:hypothetical protein